MQPNLRALWKRVSGREVPEQLPAAVESAYGESHRRYHTMAHIHDCLDKFDPAAALDPDSVEVAIWFHDVIYNTQQPDNEEQSAQWIAEWLRESEVDAAFVDRVSHLIVTTKHHVVEGDPDASLLVDIDLSILGEEAQVFDQYDCDIRVEYEWVPEEQYAAARQGVLEGFLNRDRIFQTEVFYQRYEKAAKENLQRAVDALTQ